MQAGHPVAWILAGDFRFSSDAAKHEATPDVPAHKALISIGDFVLTRRAAHWPAVKRLRVPRNPLRQDGSWWRVRFAGRAVVLKVQFGSNPDRAAIARADRFLAAVRRKTR